MRIVPLLLALSLSCAADVSLVPRGGVEEHQGIWSFVVDGRTDLPDGARLEVEVYALREVSVPDGTTEIEEVPIGDGKATVHDSTFRVATGNMPHSPYSTKYRAKVIFDPSLQSDDILAKVPGVTETLSRGADFRLGKEADLPREKQEADKGVVSDLMALHDLWNELEARFKPMYTGKAPTDLAAWDAWRKEWNARRKPLEESNKGRIIEDIYWRESYGKRYIESMLDELPEIADFYREVLAKTKDPQPTQEEVGRIGKQEETKYWQRLDFLGITLIAHPKEVLSILDDIDARVKRLVAMREAAGKKDPSFTPQAWEAETDAARTAFAQVPARLSSELPETYFGQMTKLVQGLLSLLQPPSQAVDPAPVLSLLASLRKDVESQGK